MLNDMEAEAWVVDGLNVIDYRWSGVVARAADGRYAKAIACLPDLALAVARYIELGKRIEEDFNNIDVDAVFRERSELLGVMETTINKLRSING